MVGFLHTYRGKILSSQKYGEVRKSEYVGTYGTNTSITYCNNSGSKNNGISVYVNDTIAIGCSVIPIDTTATWQ